MARKNVSALSTRARCRASSADDRLTDGLPASSASPPSVVRSGLGRLDDPPLLDVLRAVAVHLVREQEQAVGRQEAAAIQAEALPRARIEDEQAELAPRLQVGHEGIVGPRSHVEPQQVLVGGLDEARGAGQERRPGTVPGVEGGRHCQALPSEQGPKGFGDLRGHDPPDAIGVVTDAVTPLDLDLSLVKATHASFDAGTCSFVTGDGRHLCLGRVDGTRVMHRFVAAGRDGRSGVLSQDWRCRATTFRRLASALVMAGAGTQ